MSAPVVEKLLSYEQAAGGDYMVEDAACAFLTDPNNTLRWDKWVNITEYCVGEEAGLTWDAEQQKCVAKPFMEGKVLLFSLLAGGIVLVILGGLLFFLIIKHRQLQDYVKVMEEAQPESSYIEVGFTSPLDEAVSVLQVRLSLSCFHCSWSAFYVDLSALMGQPFSFCVFRLPPATLFN
eukprot:scaffold143172_cov33-Prasinocladus_malaysianus.AAC.1